MRSQKSESRTTAKINEQEDAHPHFHDVEGFNLDKKSFSLKELFQGIFGKLNQLFAVDCAALTIYDKEKHLISCAYLSELIGGEVAFRETVAHPMSLSPMAKEIADFDFPVLKSRQDWMDHFGENHFLIADHQEYDFHGYVPIEHHGRVLATLELHNIDREISADAITYCCTISDFVAGLLNAIEERATNNIVQRSSGKLETLAKPIQDKVAVKRIAELENEVEQLRNQLAEFQTFSPDESEQLSGHPKIIGNSPEMQKVFKLLNQVAKSSATVLILGETGTGKGLIAQAIHDDSERRQQPIINVNCAAIPPNLIESELFGHEKASFTGATERRIGKFELANKGTIFLDEVGELSLELQVKLLRVLQEREIERVGGTTTISVDVRVISATNRDLLAEVEAGRFRRDLFYRLNVFPISLPPLRNRKNDLPILAHHFLQKFALKSKRNIEGFSKKAISSMTPYSWPGNVRELEHLIERQVVLAQGTIIKDLEIPTHNERSLTSVPMVKTIFENEREHIYTVLALCNGKISGANGAAKLLGVPATTLNSKIKRLGLEKKHRV